MLGGSCPQIGICLVQKLDSAYITLDTMHMADKLDDTYAHIEQTLADAQRILVIQADNPDADSLGSALALEQLLEERGKSVYLYCGIRMPDYLHYVSGWDRVMDTVPSQFDASIIVDTSTMTLLQKLEESGSKGWVAAKPCIVLDHHAKTDESIQFVSVILNRPEVSSTGELLYDLAQHMKWPLDTTSGTAIMHAILGDTQGLSNAGTSAHTYRVMAELTELGVNRPLLEEQRREYAKMDPRIFRYKGELISRTEILADDRLAMVAIPQTEINTYSPLYNPAPLIQGDMLQTLGVHIAIVLKHYDDGKILGSIRCNNPAPIASDLAAAFNGGGHPYAAGFKITDGRPLNEVKSECIRLANDLLNAITTKDSTHEAVQHTLKAH